MNFQNILFGLVFLLFVFSGCTNTSKMQINNADLEIRAFGSEKDGKSSARYEQVSHALASEKGCLSCHEGIEIINDNMQPFLLGFAKKQYGKGAGYECAICHEGNPSSGSKEEAHSSLIPNPSSMWVLHEGKGCAKCHDSKGSITTLMGKPLSQPVGGGLMSEQMLSSEPSGVLGTDYTYRMATSLHALMTGIASKTLSSNGVIPKGSFPYGNFDTIDTDGRIPRVGSEKIQGMG